MHFSFVFLTIKIKVWDIFEVSFKAKIWVWVRFESELIETMIEFSREIEPTSVI